MFSLGIFHDIKLQNNNNVIFSLEKACDDTSELVQGMNNYQRPSFVNKNYKSVKKDNINKNRNQSVIGRSAKNIINNYNNSNKGQKRINQNFNNGKLNKYKIIQNKILRNNSKKKNNNNYIKKNNELYNYNKEYEDNLLNQIENILHPKSNNEGLGQIEDMIKNDYMNIFSLMK